MTISVLDTTGTPTRPDAYLHDVVDAPSAARLLDVSVQRWRQITGPQLSPNPALPPVAIEGVRGARWRLRNVCRFALVEDRPLQMSVPTLLPLDQTRYTPLGHGAELTPTTSSDTQVWAQLFTPTAAQRCGQPEGLLLMLTPLAKVEPAVVVAQLQHLVRCAAEVAHWSDALRSHDGALTIAVLTNDHTPTSHNFTGQVTAAAGGAPLPSDEALPAGEGLVWAGVVAAELYQAIGAAPSRLEALRVPWTVASWMAPAADVAGCVGWPALPWWPAGTATAELCAQWAPGLVAEIPVPADLAARSRAAAWITAQQPRAWASAQDYAELARLLDPARDHSERSRRDVPAPEGYEAVVEIAWELSSPDQQRDPHPMVALDQILGDFTTPDPVAEVLHTWMSDPSFAPAVHYRTADLPPAWAQALTTVPGSRVDLDECDSPRWKHLLAAHQQWVNHDLAEIMHECDVEAQQWGPTQTPVVICDHGMTLAPPTGFTPAGVRRRVGWNPAGALQTDEFDAIVEILLLPCTDGRITGLARTASEQILPLPLPASPAAGRSGTAALWVAAWTGWNHGDLTTAATRGTDPMNELLASTTTPRTINPDELTHIAHQALQIYRPGTKI